MAPGCPKPYQRPQSQPTGRTDATKLETRDGKLIRSAGIKILIPKPQRSGEKRERGRWGSSQAYVLGEFYSSGNLGGFAVLSIGSIIAAGKVNRYSSSGSRSLGWLLKVDKNGCLDSLCNLTNPQSESPSISAGFHIYPNPTDDLINISTSYPLPFDIKCFDAFGRDIFEKEQVSNHLEIDLSAWKNGVYFIALTMSGKCVLRKVVKLEP